MNRISTIVACISAVLVCALISIWPLRILCSRTKGTTNKICMAIWIQLKKMHVGLGIISIIVVLFHCMLTRQVSMYKSPMGAFLLMCLLALAMTGAMKKMIPNAWKTIHKIIAVLLFCGMVFHSCFEFFF